MPQPDPHAANNRRKLPLWAKRIIWHLDGHAGRSIKFWIAAQRLRYWIGVGTAERVCRGNRGGNHTPHYDARFDLGGQCFCDRVRRRLDFIPF